MSKRTSDPTTGLTPQQEMFCVEMVKTGNALEAYRLAYPKQKMNPNTLSVNACRMADNPKIALRLADLRSEVRKGSGITLLEHLTTLQELREEARSVAQFSAAITAEVSRGKVSGLYDADDDGGEVPAPVKVEISVVDGRKQA
jgi:phage terminase small subunit